MKITPNSLTLNQLLGIANEQFVVPAYQRRFSWRDRQIVELLDDLDLLDGTDTHLLGSIVCLTGNHTAGINKLELVDGQQRLTTIAILLECIRERFKSEDRSEQASELSRLLAAKSISGVVAPKIALDTLDGAEFNQHLNISDRNSDETYGNVNLELAFVIVREFISDKSNDKIEVLLYRLLHQAIIIRLDVADAKDAFKLFETINNRGLKLSPTDIIKNFVLGNAARLGAPQLDDARKSWAKM